MNPPATELIEILRDVRPGRALDLAAGGGRHSIWLRDRGWDVTAVDIAMEDIDGVTCIRADLEQPGFTIQPGTWDVIVCWLYWQENLLDRIAQGVHAGGLIALAGKTSGRFATSLDQYRKALAGWEEIRAGVDDYKAFLIAREPGNT